MRFYTLYIAVLQAFNASPFTRSLSHLAIPAAQPHFPCALNIPTIWDVSSATTLCAERPPKSTYLGNYRTLCSYPYPLFNSYANILRRNELMFQFCNATVSAPRLTRCTALQHRHTVFLPTAPNGLCGLPSMRPISWVHHGSPSSAATTRTTRCALCGAGRRQAREQTPKPT